MDLSYDGTGVQDKGSGIWYYKRVDRDGTDTASADTWHQGNALGEVEFFDETTEESVFDCGGKELDTIHGDRMVGYRFKAATDEFNIHKFLKTEVFGKYFAILLDDGWNRTDSASGDRMKKFVFTPVCKIPRAYRKTAPGGRQTEMNIPALNNTAVVTFGSVTTAIASLISLCEVDATIAAASLDFTVSINEQYEIVEINEA